MKKQLKILLIVAALVIVLLIVLLLLFMINKNKGNGQELNSMNFNISLESIENNKYVSIDDFGKLLNNNSLMQEEKFLNDNVGIYNLNLYGDGENTTLKYTVKNHDTKKIEAFDYKLMFINDEGQVFNNVLLNSQEIPGLATYDVVVNISGNVVGTYVVLPTLEIQEEGKNGGVCYEKY